MHIIDAKGVAVIPDIDNLYSTGDLVRGEFSYTTDYVDVDPSANGIYPRPQGTPLDSAKNYMWSEVNGLRFENRIDCSGAASDPCSGLLHYITIAPDTRNTPVSLQGLDLRGELSRNSVPFAVDTPAYFDGEMTLSFGARDGILIGDDTLPVDDDFYDAFNLGPRYTTPEPTVHGTAGFRVDTPGGLATSNFLYHLTSLTVTRVSEPTTTALLALGLFGAGAAARRRRARA